MADPRATMGGAVLRAWVWALGGRCERVGLVGTGRRRWHVASHGHHPSRRGLAFAQCRGNAVAKVVVRQTIVIQ